MIYHARENDHDSILVDSGSIYTDDMSNTGCKDNIHKHRCLDKYSGKQNNGREMTCTDCTHKDSNTANKAGNRLPGCNSRGKPGNNNWYIQRKTGMEQHKYMTAHIHTCKDVRNVRNCYS